MAGNTSAATSEAARFGTTRKRRVGALVAVGVVIVVLGAMAPLVFHGRQSAIGVVASSPEVADLIRRTWKLVDNPGRGRAELEAACRREKLFPVACPV